MARPKKNTSAPKKQAETSKANEPIKPVEVNQEAKIEPVQVESIENNDPIELAQVELPENPQATTEEPVAKQESKVVEAQTKKPKPEPRIRTKRTKRFPVIVKGKTRLMSKQSYEAVVKDPKLEVALPEGSELIEYVPKKGCKDC